MTKKVKLTQAAVRMLSHLAAGLLFEISSGMFAVLSLGLLDWVASKLQTVDVTSPAGVAFTLIVLALGGITALISITLFASGFVIAAHPFQHPQSVGQKPVDALIPKS